MQEPLGPIGLNIEKKLRRAFQPTKLELIDESNQHHGHIGARASGESHFRLRISARTFVGKSLIAQHRMIHEVLVQELQTQVHALSITIV